MHSPLFYMLAGAGFAAFVIGAVGLVAFILFVGETVSRT